MWTRSELVCKKLCTVCPRKQCIVILRYTHTCPYTVTHTVTQTHTCTQRCANAHTRKHSPMQKYSHITHAYTNKYTHLKNTPQSIVENINIKQNAHNSYHNDNINIKQNAHNLYQNDNINIKQNAHNSYQNDILHQFATCRFGLIFFSPI